MKNIHRREVLKTSGQAIVALSLPLNLWSCGRDREFSQLHSTSRDLIIRQVGVVPSEYLDDPRPLTLFFREFGHKHAIAIAKEDLQKVAAGQSLSLVSEKTWGHDHTVTIDPSKRFESTFRDCQLHIEQEEGDPIPVDVFVSASELQALQAVTKTFDFEGATYLVELSIADLCALRAGISARQIEARETNGDRFKKVIVMA